MSLVDVTLFATAFTTLTVIMDPIGTVPIFLGLTSRYSQAKQRRAAIQATSVSFGVILTFAILGGQILRLLSISMEALQLSGGVLLFLVAMELLMGTDSSTPDTGDESVNVALVPLGTPLLAGPGSIVAVMVAVGQAGTERRIVDRRRPGRGAGARRHVADDALFAHPLSAAGTRGHHAVDQDLRFASRCYCNATHHGGNFQVYCDVPGFLNL